MKLLIALAVLATAAILTHGQSLRSFPLPDGSEFFLGGDFAPSFRCEGNTKYGYYADVGSDCRAFHVCVPIPDDNLNIIEVHQYSFFCGNQTVFDQARLVCDHVTSPDLIPCAQSPDFYSVVNDRFGEIPPSN